jgi:hypothetical protein
MIVDELGQYEQEAFPPAARRPSINAPTGSRTLGGQATLS